MNQYKLGQLGKVWSMMSRYPEVLFKRYSHFRIFLEVFGLQIHGLVSTRHEHVNFVDLIFVTVEQNCALALDCLKKIR